jgi:hypothetical protein
MAAGIRGEKRPLEEGADSASKATREESANSSLPLEMLENIIKYLPDADLIAMAQVDSAYRKAALHERVVRVFRVFPKELEKFAADQYLLPADALATLNVAHQCLAIKQGLMATVKAKNISFLDIDQSAQQLKETLVALALIPSIVDSPNPVAARGEAVINSAGKGHLAIVQALLENGPISEVHRGEAVMNSASNGRLELVQALLANGATISLFARGVAVVYATGKGHLAIVRALLENGPISESSRGSALRVAEVRGHHAMAEILKPKSRLDSVCVIS